MKYVILLTACINPNGMAFTRLTDPTERKRQYVEAVDFYLKNTRLPIVFAENSNSDISCLFPNQISIGRLEIITFKGNEDKYRGKGYGEAEIIEYAIAHSKFIKDNCFLIKITGRLIVENIRSIFHVHRVLKLNKAIQFSTNSKFKFADSRLVIFPLSFVKCFLNRKLQIDDSKGAYFEHVLLNTIKEEQTFYYLPFLVEPQILGISGSTGKEYNFKYNTLYNQAMYLNYQLWLVLKYPLFSLRRMGILQAYFIRIVYYLIKLIGKVYRH